MTQNLCIQIIPLTMFFCNFQNELDMAVSFYLTTLALQSTFEPANDRLMAIYCNHSDKLKKTRENIVDKEEL